MKQNKNRTLFLVAKIQRKTVMMTQSKKHYGNPLSTVDYVVMHWRYGWGNFETIEPSKCFPRHKGGIPR